MSSDSYLELAARALRLARRPLSPMEMLDLARAEGFMPRHLRGLTKHKTLMARLSEHVRSSKGEADFYRTAPGVFFLTALSRDPDIPAEYKKVHHGSLRSKSIRKENILVAPKIDLENEIYGEFIQYNDNHFKKILRTLLSFSDRASAEKNNNIKQFVTFTLVFHENKLLTYRRGKFTTTSNNLKGQLSVGFGGHVNDQDFTLFSLDGDALRFNAARELHEELSLGGEKVNLEESLLKMHLLGYINVDGDTDAEHHIAVLVSYNQGCPDLPKKGELSINQLSWIDLDNPRYNLRDFDFWSRIILKNIENGHITLQGG